MLYQFTFALKPGDVILLMCHSPQRGIEVMARMGITHYNIEAKRTDDTTAIDRSISRPMEGTETYDNW